MTLTLDRLPAAYATARAEAIATAQPVTPGLCRYCGRPWAPPVGTRLDGHALCSITPEFREALSALYRSSPAIRREHIAAQLDVPVSIVVAWLKPRTVERGATWPSNMGEPTPEGLRALEPRPRSKAEVDDLIARVQAKTSPRRRAAAKATRERWDRYRAAKAGAETAPASAAAPEPRIQELARTAAGRAAIPQFPPGTSCGRCGQPAIGAIHREPRGAAGELVDVCHRCATGPPPAEQEPRTAATPT